MANVVMNGGPYQTVQGTAGGTIKPGYVLQGAYTALVANASLTNVGVLRIAKERAYLGDTLASTSYASGESVDVAVPGKGAKVTLVVRAAAPAIAVNDVLEAHTDGTVAKVTTGTPRFQALEAVDNSGGGSQVFIQAEVI